MRRDHDTHAIDPALLRGMTRQRLSRRQLLRYAGAGAGALSMGAILAACGTGSGTAAGPSASGDTAVGSADWWSKQQQGDTVNFANWPYYIDVEKGSHPTLDMFTADTGMKVNYFEAVQDNTEFFQKLRPSLQAGQATGYDIVVMSQNVPVFSEFLKLGWAIPLNHDMMPNFDKYASDLVNDPSWDPGNQYSMAWQSGYTGMAYNTDYIKEDITSLQALFDPKYKGKVGMMSDPLDLGSAGLLALGVDPAGSTPDDWQQAAAKLQDQKDAGIVRSYYNQSYIGALKSEDTWIGLAFSGDVFQANLSGFTNLKFLIPDEGAMFWTDNMMIPLYADNPVGAMTLMDYVYDPHIQALIEDYNHYICPVPAARDIIANELNDPEVAKSPLVFPTPEMVAISKAYYSFKDNEEVQTWNDTFLPLVQG